MSHMATKLQAADVCPLANGMHQWTPDPEVSGNAVTRYTCPCGRWGARVWPRMAGARMPPVRPYLHGFDRQAYLKNQMVLPNEPRPAPTKRRFNRHDAEVLNHLERRRHERIQAADLADRRMDPRCARSLQTEYCFGCDATVTMPHRCPRRFM